MTSRPLPISAVTVASEREQFCAVLSTGPLRAADAIVVLSGDGTARLHAAAQLFRQGGAPRIILAGGLDDPPYSLPAAQMAVALYGMGIAPDRVQVDSKGMHTRGIAESVVATARRHGWRTLALVASPEHQYRAFLTFVQVLLDGGLDRDIRLVNVPAGDLRWCDVPAGKSATRLHLLSGEFAKAAEYQARGHCATFAAGLAYLTHWES